VHIKDFYKAYTRYYNPSLFDVDNKKNEKTKYTPKEKDISDIFQKLF